MSQKPQIPYADATLDVIHAAARRVYARDGVHQASMPEIAAEAGMSLDELNEYYPCEDDLLRGIIARWATQTAREETPKPIAMESMPSQDAATGGLNGRSALAPMPAMVPAEKSSGSQTLLPNSPQMALLSVPPCVRRGGRVPISEIFASALRSLSANKLRTFLTMLGMVIGVGSVVGLLAIGNGVTVNITGRLTANGTNQIYVIGASASANGVANGNRLQTITLEDANALAQPGAVPDASTLSPEAQQSGQITAGSANTFGAVVGVWPSYTVVHDSGIASGDFVSDSDVKTGANVIVLGSTIASNLFGSDDPVGKNVRVLGKGFRVIGVLAAKGGSFGSPDEQAYIPLTTALSQLIGDPGGSAAVRRGRTISVIYVKAASAASVDDAVSEITDVLNVQHQTPVGTKPDFQITTQAELLKTVGSTLGIIRLFLAAVAGISLLVGGIGIMNIMLVSVTERTREIGIRKAIGATERNILLQFVVEAVLIGLIGALVGVAFGAMIALLVSATLEPSPISPTSIAVAVAFAMLTGLFFGVYPARRAANLKPIDALRYE